MTTDTTTLALPRRGRPPYVTISESGRQATLRVRGREITVPLTAAGNIGPAFLRGADTDEEYAATVVLRFLSN